MQEVILGTGGMATKLTAAKRAISVNCNMILANGENPSLLIDIVEGKEVGTLFMKKINRREFYNNE